MNYGLVFKRYTINSTHFIRISSHNLLVSTTLSDKTKVNIRKNYTNARKFCDDDIYRQLRFNQQQHDEDEEGR